MELDLVIEPGEPVKPLVVLVHGFGMSKSFWQEPKLCPVLGGLADLRIFFGGQPPVTAKSHLSLGRPRQDVPGLWDRLVDAGFGVAAWSQRESLGPISLAIEELSEVIGRVKEQYPGRPLFLVCHSRGGLVGKSYLLHEQNSGVKGLVTIGSPLKGTKLAELATYLQPLGKFLDTFLPKEAGTISGAALQRITTFLKSKATMELSPECDFVRSLDAPLGQGIRTLSFGGTTPDLFRLFVRIKNHSPWKAMSYTELLAKVIPPKKIPTGLVDGLGDGLVSAKSANLAGENHHELPCNHVALAFDGAVQQMILDFLRAK